MLPGLAGIAGLGVASFGPPVVMGSSIYQGGFSLTHDIPMPADIQPGEMLLTVVVTGPNTTLDAPANTGWSARLGYFLTSGSAMRFVKIAVANEPAVQTFTLVSTSGGAPVAQVVVAITLRIANHSGLLEQTNGVFMGGSTFYQNTNVVDPGVVTPPWGSANTLWINYVNIQSAPFSVVLTPTGYSSPAITASSSYQGLAAVYRTRNTASEDPTTWAFLQSENKMSFSIAVRPRFTP